MLAEAVDGLLLYSHSTSVFSLSSHSQCVGVLCRLCIIQDSHSSLGDSGGVSGPSDSGSRSTSRDTGEGELRTGSIEVRVN